MCVADLPAAGGYPPVWQPLHLLATVSWVWFHWLGFHALVPWQESQLVVPTGMWVAPLPLAPVPLWQLAQLVETTLWSTLAPVQVPVDLWQFSHPLGPLCTAVLGLLVAWQVAHRALTVTLVCSLTAVHEALPVL